MAKVIVFDCRPLSLFDSGSTGKFAELLSDAKLTSLPSAQTVRRYILDAHRWSAEERLAFLDGIADQGFSLMSDTWTRTQSR